MPAQLLNNQWWLHEVNKEPAVLFYIDKVQADSAGVTWVTFTRYMGGRPPTSSRLMEKDLEIIRNSRWTKHVPDPAEISKLLMLWGNFAT
jgi:hypothetical protein